MSASNWDTCPKCNKTRVARDQKLKADAAATYGKLSSDDFLSLLKDVEKKCDEELPTTLREDYELGISCGGIFYVTYGCSCQECVKIPE